MEQYELQQVEAIRNMKDEELLETFWKCINIKYGDGKELFYGRDIEKAFPKDKYDVKFFSEFAEDSLYYAYKFDHESNVVEFYKVKIWGEKL